MLFVQTNQSTTETGAPVREAIRSASRATGIPFDYLLRTAERESSLDPNAQARTSTAAGLFQFIGQTWLSTLKDSGAQHGYHREAEAIERRADGRLVVNDPAERARIMNLRFDPTANAVMAAVFTQRNLEQLTQALGRQPTQGELYIAHFLGGSGASRFLNEASRSPNASAAAQFPDAARANRSIFFTSDGRARSFADVQDRLVARHVPAPTFPAAAVATAASATTESVVRRPDGTPVFHSLFQQEGRGPVSGVVQSLWGRAPGTAALIGQDRREPFFPSSVLRVGLGRGGAAELAESGRPSDQIVSLQEAPAAARREAAASAVAAMRLPLPPERPAVAEPTPTARPVGTTSRALGRPVDLLSFIRLTRS